MPKHVSQEWYLDSNLLWEYFPLGNSQPLATDFLVTKWRRHKMEISGQNSQKGRSHLFTFILCHIIHQQIFLNYFLLNIFDAFPGCGFSRLLSWLCFGLFPFPALPSGWHLAPFCSNCGQSRGCAVQYRKEHCLPAKGKWEITPAFPLFPTLSWNARA